MLGVGSHDNQKADCESVAEINRMAIVRAVQQGAGLSRADLAKATGLTKSTVGLLVQDSIDSGWLLRPDVQATGVIGDGRRRWPGRSAPGDDRRR